MHTTKKLLPAIVTTLIIFLSVYNPLIGYFCDSTITTSKYTISLSLAIVSFCLLLCKDEYIRINHLIYIGLLITVWYIIRACISAPFSTYNLLQPISVLGLIITFSRLRKSQQPILDMAIISICFIISIHIIMQFLGLLKTSTPNFYSGPFDNPAGAAMVLTTTLPLQIHMLVKNDKHKLPTALVILATLLAIIITKSRTCLLACCVIMWLHIGCAKIVPLYKMLLSYQVINPQKAIEVANMIINYPEKVESDIAKEIKKYSYKYLQENNKL